MFKKFNPGCMTCCSGLWVFYGGGEDNTEVQSTIHIPRVAPIYNTYTSPLDTSYPDWFVDVSSGLFPEGKTFQSSIVPINQIAKELVYVYVTNGNFLGDDKNSWVQFDAASKEVKWVVFDATNWSGVAIGQLTLATSSLSFIQPYASGSGPWDEPEDPLPSAILEGWLSFGTAGAGLNGLVRWGPHPDGGAGPIDYAHIWRLSSIGVTEYIDTGDFRANWVAANPSGGFAPEYSYAWDWYTVAWTFQGFSNDEYNINDYFYPVAVAPNSTLCLGYRRPHVDPENPAIPDDLTDMWEFEATFQVAIGEIATDEYGYPYVNGTTDWSFSHTQQAGGLSYHLNNDITAKAQGFDAVPNGWIAIMAVIWPTDVDGGEGSWEEFQYDSRVHVLVNGIEAFTRAPLIMTVEETIEDNREFYPFWINPRCLQQTEISQGGGQRFAVFQRYPIDTAEVASESLPDNTLQQWRLLILDYVGGIIANFLSEYDSPPITPPIVITSSNRYLYVVGFRMSLPEDPTVFYTCWEISHDGLILNPCRGGDRLTGTEIAPGQPNPSYYLDSIKLSDFIELSPLYGER